MTISVFASENIGENPSDYRYFGKDVKLLPLNNKGLSKQEVSKNDLKISKRMLPEISFSPEIKFALKGSIENKKIFFELLEEAGVDREQAFIRFGVPFPKGALFNPKHIKILKEDKTLISLQATLLAFWEDDSIKWALIQFSTKLKANQRSVYHLVFGEKVEIYNEKSPLKLNEDDNCIEIKTGPMKAVIDKKKFNIIREVYIDSNKDGAFSDDEKRGKFGDDGIFLIDENLKKFSSSAQPPQKISIEEKGPEKIVLKIEGAYNDENGKNSLMNYVARLEFNKNSSIVKIAVTHINTFLEHEFSDISCLQFSFIPDSEIKSVKAEIADKTSMSRKITENEIRLFQENDRCLSIFPENKVSPDKLSGTVSVYSGSSSFAVSVRDCWQRWPKAFSASKKIFNVELLPRQTNKDFGKNLPHYLQFPLCEGMYRIKWGMAFTENISFDFGGFEKSGELEAENNLPVIAVLPESWYFQADVFPGVLPEEYKEFTAWDKFIADLFNEHMKLKAEQREYGFFNYGDWYGERGRNWGNNEYDFAHGLFIAFIRSGNRNYFRQAILAAEHQADVDIVHAYPNPYYIGANHQHSIGHTGDWSQGPVRARWTYAYNSHTSAENGHTWLRGMLDAWYLAGNPRTLNSALKLGEHITWALAPNLKKMGHFERAAGWALNAICALYKFNYDPQYMKAATSIADIALKSQNFHLGGAWPHSLPSGHNGGNKNTSGNSCFMIAVLLEGLKSYYEISGRSDVAKSIIAGSNWLLSAWSDDDLGWPLTASASGASYWPARACSSSMLMAPQLACAANLSGEKKFYDAAVKAFESTVLVGSHYNGRYMGPLMCLSPELITEIVKWQKKHPGAKKNLLNGKISQILKQIHTQNLNIRGPQKKDFILRLQKTNPQIEITRIAVKGNESRKGCITIKNNKTYEKIEFQMNEVFSDKIRLEGNVGDIFRITIEDNMKGIWNIQSDSVDIFARTSTGFRLGGIGISRYFITVPKGTNKFLVEICGIYEGLYGAAILDENNKILGTKNELIKANRKVNIKDLQNMAINIPVRVNNPEKHKIYKLYIWANNDVYVKLKNIPPFLSITETMAPVGGEN